MQSLPHTLNVLKWEYGQLRQANESEYICEMFHLLYDEKKLHEYDFLTHLISEAQKLVRRYALNHLRNLLGTATPRARLFDKVDKAEIFSQSTVSQRDIQRVFTLYDWLENWFLKPTKYGKEDKFHVSVRALFVALALVYYFRLNNRDREHFRSQIFMKRSIGTSGIPPTFEESLSDELDWVGQVIDLPIGVAPTDALKENIYAILVCTMVRIPVIIVGPPGSSKTLSFKIVIDNCQGQVSKHEELKDFKSLDPHPYQCSRKSTSSEIETVFHRAINRQRTIDPNRNRMIAVVLMDEAGLPESSHESMKVLHDLLDDPKVSLYTVACTRLSLLMNMKVM